MYRLLKTEEASKMFSDVLVAVAVVLAKVPDAWKPDRFSFGWTIIAYIRNMEILLAMLRCLFKEFSGVQGAGSGLPTPLLSRSHLLSLISQSKRLEHSLSYWPWISSGRASQLSF